jgi:hypothetical protein
METTHVISEVLRTPEFNRRYEDKWAQRGSGGRCRKSSGERSGVDGDEWMVDGQGCVDLAVGSGGGAGGFAGVSGVISAWQSGKWR